MYFLSNGSGRRSRNFTLIYVTYKIIEGIDIRCQMIRCLIGKFPILAFHVTRLVRLHYIRITSMTALLNVRKGQKFEE